MLQLVNIVSDELGLSLNDLTFEKGKSYCLNSTDSNFNLFISDLLRGMYLPTRGSIYVTLDGSTDNLLTVNDKYINTYSRRYVYLENGIDLIDDLTIKDNMLLLSKMYSGAKWVKLRKLLNMVHINDADVKVKNLSEIDRYGVKFAQILYMRPNLIICNNIFKDSTNIESMVEVESLLCDLSKYLSATLIYMGKALNTDNFDVILSKSAIVKEVNR